MSTNWDLLIEKHFNKKSENAEELTLGVLIESINEVLDTMPDPEDYLLTEQKAPSGGRFSMSIPIPKLIPTEAWVILIVFPVKILKKYLMSLEERAVSKKG